MDINGARHRADRIAQQQHWSLAEAVREGRQPASDPDGHRHEELGEGYRLYVAEPVRGADGLPTLRWLSKTLVDGRWEATMVDAPPQAEPPGEP